MYLSESYVCFYSIKITFCEKVDETIACHDVANNVVLFFYKFMLIFANNYGKLLVPH